MTGDRTRGDGIRERVRVVVLAKRRRVLSEKQYLRRDAPLSSMSHDDVDARGDIPSQVVTTVPEAAVGAPGAAGPDEVPHAAPPYIEDPKADSALRRDGEGDRRRVAEGVGQRGQTERNGRDVREPGLVGIAHASFGVEVFAVVDFHVAVSLIDPGAVEIPVLVGNEAAQRRWSGAVRDPLR